MSDPEDWPWLARLAMPDDPPPRALADARAMVELARSLPVQFEASAPEQTSVLPEAVARKDRPVSDASLAECLRRGAPALRRERLVVPPDRAPSVRPLDPHATTRSAVLAASNGALVWPGEPEPTASGDTGPLAGMRVAVKDNLWVRGTPCTAGSRMLAGFVPPQDAEVWRRIRRAGGHMTGKTNLDAFGMGASGEHSAFGPTQNPRNPGWVPGGSSSGSAAAVAAGWADAALGSDTGGSVRLPAAFCRLFGFKPSYGALSRRGLVAFASSLDVVGILTRTIEDALRLFEATSGPDPNDLCTLNPPASRRGLMGRVVVLEPWVDGPGFGDVEAALSSMNARVERRSAPTLQYSEVAYRILSSAEAASNLARYDGLRFGLRVDAESFDEMVVRTRQAGFGLEVQRRILSGTAAAAAGGRLVHRAEGVRTRLRRELLAALDGADAIVAATTPVGPFAPESRLGDPQRLYEVDRYTIVASLAGLCALSVPLPPRQDSPAPAVQLIGAPGAERLILELGARLERAGSLRDLTAPEPGTGT